QQRFTAQNCILGAPTEEIGVLTCSPSVARPAQTLRAVLGWHGEFLNTSRRAGAFAQAADFGSEESAAPTHWARCQPLTHRPCLTSCVFSHVIVRSPYGRGRSATKKKKKKKSRQPLHSPVSLRSSARFCVVLHSYAGF
ncbi:hypothetical protein ANANG_G00071560, partial [Anguilla anguilla]